MLLVCASYDPAVLAARDDDAYHHQNCYWYPGATILISTVIATEPLLLPLFYY